MGALVVERDSEILIDNQLKNLGWINDPKKHNRNVYQQRAKTDEQTRKLQGLKPDYILYASNSNEPLAIIEAKKRGANIHTALEQGLNYAQRIDAPLVFASDGVFTKTLHVRNSKPLTLNGEEIDELIRETMALKYLGTNAVVTLDKKVIQSRSELISIFNTVNDLLREEGLQKGLERFTEFANILFLKVLSEIQDGNEERGEPSTINRAFRWNHFRDKRGHELLSYVNEVVLRHFSREYEDENIFQPLQIKHPDNLRAIIDLLDGLQLTDINADIKGDAFEYFIRSYSASNPSDLGEIFTPRHVVKTMVKLLNPQIGDRIYDPFCGTGGMLIVAFKHLMDTMNRTPATIKMLKENTIYGADLTKTASIAKMNMILAGDGHNNIARRDSLANPIDREYEIVLTNMPFGQKTRYGDLYDVPTRNADVICPQHCFRALREGGKMALIVPEGFIANTNEKAYEDVRRYLLDHATLKSVISLPRGAFEPYNRAKADILFFTDAKISRTKGHYWFFDVRNDGFTLDKKRQRVEGGNDLELVLSENDLEKQSEDYLLSIGISRIDLEKVKNNEYVLNAAPYREIFDYGELKFPILKLGDFLEQSGSERIGTGKDAPVMSITMAQGLIDQSEKFTKRIASADISAYKKVYRNELVVGFPIDEGVLGFQIKYEYAAVSPAYTIWKLKRRDIDLKFFELLLRSPAMRRVYRAKMQGAVDRRRNITKEVFLGIRIPIPPLDVQQRIVAKHQEIEGANVKIRKLEQEISEDLTALWKQKGDENPNHREDFDSVLKKAATSPPAKPRRT